MATEALVPRALERARLAQGLTIAWMSVEAAVAIGAAVMARSVALGAFGADSVIELLSAGVVLRQLLRRTVLDEGHELSPGERGASRFVGWALYAVIIFIVLSSAGGLLVGVHAQASPVGIVLAVASIGVMAALWRWRLRLAAELQSPALKGDAACSAVCLYMAARRWQASS